MIMEKLSISGERNLKAPPFERRKQSRIDWRALKLSLKSLRNIRWNARQAESIDSPIFFFFHITFDSPIHQSKFNERWNGNRKFIPSSLYKFLHSPRNKWIEFIPVRRLSSIFETFERIDFFFERREDSRFITRFIINNI